MTVWNLQAVGQLAPSFPGSKSDRSITGRNSATRKSSGAVCAVQSVDLVQRLARDAVRAQEQHLSLTRRPLGLIETFVPMILSAAISKSCTSLRTSSPPSMGYLSSVLSYRSWISRTINCARLAVWPHILPSRMCGLTQTSCATWQPRYGLSMLTLYICDLILRHNALSWPMFATVILRWSRYATGSAG